MIIEIIIEGMAEAVILISEIMISIPFFVKKTLHEIHARWKVHD